MSVNPTLRTAPLPVRRPLWAVARLVRGAMATVCALGVTMAVPSPVAAQAPAAAQAPINDRPVDRRVESDGPNRWVVDGSLLGFDSMSIPADGRASLSVELPPGMQGERLLGSFDSVPSGAVPPDSVGVATAGQPMVNLPFTAGSVSVDLTTRTPQADPSGIQVEAMLVSAAPCRPVSAVFLRDVAVAASGSPTAPTSFATFFPDVLDRVVIRLSAAEAKQRETAQAVVDLASFVTHRWPAARVVVTDRDIPLSPALSPALSPFDRVIELRTDSKPVVAIGSGSSTPTPGTWTDSGRMPSLVLGGPVALRAQQVAFVTSSLFGASFLSSADPKPVAQVASTASAVSGGTRVSLADLRGGPVVGEGAGQASVAIGVTQARFGGQMASVKAKAKGVARVEGSEFVTVQLRGNDRILATQRVRTDEVFELNGTIEAPSLRADNVFQVRAAGHASDDVASPGSALGSADQCAPGSTRPQVSVELDPASVFEGIKGTAVLPGFERFPQAFVQGFDVRLASMDVVTLSAAASMVQLLQRESPVVLRPRATVGEVTDFDGLAGFDALTQPTLVVSANSVPIESMGQAFAGIVPATGDGASLIAAIEGREADHLLLAAGPGSSVGDLPSSLLADRAGLRSLKGDLFIERAGVTRNVRVQTVSKRVELPQPQVYEARVRYPLWFGFLLGVVIALVVVMSRHRRQHS